MMLSGEQKTYLTLLLSKAKVAKNCILKKTIVLLIYSEVRLFRVIINIDNQATFGEFFSESRIFCCDFLTS